CAQLLGQRLNELGRRLVLLVDEEAVQLAAYELGAGGLLERDSHDVRRLPGPLLLQKRLFSRVELAGVELKSALVVEVTLLPCPAGEGPGGLTDVGFGVVADADREQLQEFAGEVLVRLGFLAAGAVEPDQHGSVADHGGEQIGELAE